MTERHLVIVSSKDDCLKLKRLRFGENAEVLIACCVAGVSVDPDCLATIAKSPNVVVSATDIREIEDVITKFDITLLETALVEGIWEALSRSCAPLREQDTFDLLASQNNMMALSLHSVVAFYLYVEHIVETFSPDVVHIFSTRNAAFRLPERPDIGFLYFPTICFGPVATFFCASRQLACRHHGKAPSFLLSGLTNFRSLLLQTYKFLITARRILGQTRKSAPKCVKDASAVKRALVIIRSASEFWSIRPVLSALEQKHDWQSLIVQDDLIKSPSSKATLDRENVEYLPIHSATSLAQAILTWARCTAFASRMRKLSRRRVEVTDERAEHPLHRFFLQNIGEVIRTATRPLPELSLFCQELTGISDLYRPSAIITLDMVDQWGGAVGHLGRQIGVKTFTLQNTALDSIVYPRPISTDVFWLANQKTHDMLYLSRPRRGESVVTGLPMNDEIVSQAQNWHRRDVLSSNRQALGFAERDKIILVATQPFQEPFPFNKRLIQILAEALAGVENARILVKLHPREKKSDFNCWMSELMEKDTCIEFAAEGNILEYLKIADLFVSRTSTAIQTALLADVPTVSCLENYPSSIVKRLDYLETDAVKKIYSASDLTAFLQSFFTSSREKTAFSERRRRYLQENIGPDPGNATARVIESLEASLGARNNQLS